MGRMYFMIIFLVFSRLVFWSVGLGACALLVYWSIGLLVYWSIGLLVFWSFGLLVFRSLGLLFYLMLKIMAGILRAALSPGQRTLMLSK